MSPRCDDCGAERLTLVTDVPLWERRAGIERYECLRCGSETTHEPATLTRHAGPAP